MSYSYGLSYDHTFWATISRYLHVLSGIMWIGLLWYFNFVQIPNMPNIPDEQKPAIGKVIAQRIKLSKELSKRATGKTLYILDEPTTGLHVHDIKKLLEVLQTLVSQGNTVVVIEHNLDVIKTADWVIDLGPEGGDGGGEIVAVGTPEKISKVKKSYTGKYLKALLNEKNN